MSIVLMVGHETSEILFQDLMYPLRLAVRLGVVCGGHALLDSEKFEEALPGWKSISSLAVSISHGPLSVHTLLPSPSLRRPSKSPLRMSGLLMVFH